MREQHSKQTEPSLGAQAVGERAIQLTAAMQRELDALREQLAWSNRLGQLGMLTAALAHETNNLLTPIGSYAQLALANPGNAELTQRALQAAAIGTRKAAKLVEGVMGVACPAESAAMSCQVKQVVDEAIACMMPIAKQHGITMRTAVEPACVGIDALALEQVLINLISNASQAMAGMSRKRNILIESSQLNGRLILQVIDSGPGVAEAIGDKLFEPFVTTPAAQASSIDTAGRQHAGSGLGLSICKQIIEAAGGKINLADSSADGSIFQIELPLAAES